VHPCAPVARCSALCQRERPNRPDEAGLHELLLLVMMVMMVMMMQLLLLRGCGCAAGPRYEAGARYRRVAAPGQAAVCIVRGITATAAATTATPKSQGPEHAEQAVDEF
jgi:hypothetical protein